MNGTSATRLDRGDLLVALGAVAVALTAYALLFQERLYGDASFLFFGYSRGQVSYHVAHWATTRLFHGLGADLGTALRLASLVPASLAPGLGYLAFRRSGASRGGSLLAAAFAAASSSSLFFATTIEVHGVQMALAHLGLLALVFLPRRSLPASLALGALGAACVALAHTTGILALPGVLVAFWVGLRRGGLSRAALTRTFAVLGLLALVTGVLVARRFLAVQGFGVEDLVDWALWDLSPAREGSWVPAPLLLMETQLVRPLFLLVPLAALFTIVDAFRARERAAIVAAWVLVPTLVLAGVPIAERGAYFLTVVPALSLALAHGADRVAGPPRARWVLVPLLVVALGVQGYVAAFKQSLWDAPLPPEGRAWVNGLLEVSDGRGVFLTADPRHFQWAEGWTRLPAESSLKSAGLPPDQVLAATRTYAEWARYAADTGDPLYVDASLAALAGADPTVAASFAILEETFELTPVESGPFRALRGR